MERSGERFDVIVVGGGIMGLCTARDLAKRGLSVVLLERFDFLHQLGSSHGGSRTIRATSPEFHYPSLVLESHRLWEEAQSESGYRVLTPTLHLDTGPAGYCTTLQSVISNCEPDSINSRLLDRAQVRNLFLLQLPEGWAGLVTNVAGVILPTKAVAMFHALAAKAGAVLKDRMEVREIEKDEEGGGVWVSTAGGDRFWGRKCVVTVGPWTTQLVERVTGRVLPVQPLRTTTCYWKIKEGHEKEFTPAGGFPTFASYDEPYVYGTPSIEFPGLIKVSVHGGNPCDPDRIRDWAPSSGAFVDPARAWLDQVLPGLIESGGPIMTHTCTHSMTPDGDFIIDFLGGEFGNDVVVAGGFSGTGFKMGPVVGRILAELSIDGVAAGVELRRFKLDRFEYDPNSENVEVL